MHHQMDEQRSEISWNVIFSDISRCYTQRSLLKSDKKSVSELLVVISSLI